MMEVSEAGEPQAPALALIEGLAGEGEAVGDGQFTLDTARALVKLRDYQLANPRTYILLVIQAAFVASDGDAQLRIERGRETTIEFRGAPFGADQLDQIFAAVFRKDRAQDDDSPRAAQARDSLRLLALALNGALALEPLRVSLEVADAEGRVNTAEFDRNRTFFVTRHVREDLPGLTRFRLQRGAGLLGTEERMMLWQRCRYSRMSIFVDGKLLSEGQRAAATAREVGSMPEFPVMFEGRAVGYAGFTRKVEDDCALIYTNGVLAERLPLPSKRGFIAVVDLDLSKDLSHSALVRDERFEALREVLHAVNRNAGPRPEALGPVEQPTMDPEVPKAMGLMLLFFFLIMGMLAGGMWLSDYRNQRDAERILEERAVLEASAEPDSTPEAPAHRSQPRPVAELMRGVRSLPSAERPPGELRITAPGFAVAQAKLTTVVAAAEWGRGRVVALGSREWLREAKFVTNASRWAHGPDAPSPLSVVCALGPSACEDLDVRVFGRRPSRAGDWVAALGDAAVLIIEAERLSSSADRRALEEFVRDGGGLVIAGHGHDWLARHPSSSLADYPGNLLLRDAGIAWGNATLAGDSTRTRITPAPEP